MQLQAGGTGHGRTLRGAVELPNYRISSPRLAREGTIRGPPPWGAGGALRSGGWSLVRFAGSLFSCPDIVYAFSISHLKFTPDVRRDLETRGDRIFALGFSI